MRSAATMEITPFLPNHARPWGPEWPAPPGALWMIDHAGCTVLRCRCLDSFGDGLSLRVPTGYGVAEGQQVELALHLPGQSAPPGPNPAVRWPARVVRTRPIASSGAFDLDVELQVLSPR